MKPLLFYIACTLGVVVWIGIGMIFSAFEEGEEVDLGQVLFSPLKIALAAAFVAALPLIGLSWLVERGVLRMRRWLRDKPSPPPIDELD